MNDYTEVQAASLAAGTLSNAALRRALELRERAEREAARQEEVRRYEVWAGERDIRYARKLLELPEFRNWPGVAEGLEGLDPEVTETQACTLLCALADLIGEYHEEGQEFGL